MPRTILFVSKPVAPPWNDSSKNLVRHLALCGQRFRYRVMTTPDAPGLEAAGVIPEAIYRAPGGFSPALLQNARTFARLLRADDSALAHFFFAPNPRSGAAIRLLLALRPRLTVQTVCSEPRSFERAAASLFGRRIVALSHRTHEKFVEAGVDPSRIVEIPPGIPLPGVDEWTPAARAAARSRLGLPAGGAVVVFPGDYQFSTAAWTFARAVERLSDRAATFVFACRVKQGASREIERAIRAELSSEEAAGRVRFAGEVARMQDLLVASDLCVLVAESLYAKMDLPMVLLEAMSLGVPIVVADRPPLSELVPAREPPGATVAPGDPEALAGEIGRLLAAPDLRAAMGARARALAEARFDIREVARRHEDLYEQLLEQRV
jgi:glycosyltransferase involved in cell wall biosynthesis